MEELLSNTSGDSSIQSSFVGDDHPDDSSSIYPIPLHSTPHHNHLPSTNMAMSSPLTNALLVSSPAKLVPPPRESDWNPWQADLTKTQLTNSLWDAVHDEDLLDVYLVARNGEQIPASRFVLAARSPVLKRMLYGSFREAKSSTICMMGYEPTVLQGVVQYCQSNTLPNLLNHHENSMEQSVRQLVRLYAAADFLELSQLGDLVHLEIRRLTGLYPGLACTVFDEVEDTSTQIGDYARLMMEVRPYVSLGASRPLPGHEENDHDDGNEQDKDKKKWSAPSQACSVGGVECLRAERLKEILHSPNLMCGELFLFQMLRQWYDHKISFIGERVDESVEYEKEATDLLEAALECAKCLSMENIEPTALIQVVQPCPFIHPTFLFDAFAKQALRASQNRIWSLHSRPAKYQAVERVLVEDCGSAQAQGMYVRMISGLKKTSATLYTKREVVSGQAMVYTLSCSVNHGMVECRIFCSPLLTPQAIPTLMEAPAQVDPLFQPILQIVAMKPSNLAHKRTRTIVVSDGHACMHATLANNVAIHNSKEIQLYGVVQILAFRLYQSNSGSSSGRGIPKIHIQRVSIVNSNAGQVFGRPTFFQTTPTTTQDVSVAEETDDGESMMNLPNELILDDDGASAVVESDDASTNFVGHHQTTVKNLQNVTVLYSCSYPLKKQARDTRIPRQGWQSEEAGQYPAPKCTWFPPVKKSLSLQAANTAVSAAVNGLKQARHKKKNSSSSLSLGSAAPPKNLGSMLKYDGDIEDEQDAEDDLSSSFSHNMRMMNVDDSVNDSTSSLGPLSLGPSLA